MSRRGRGEGNLEQLPSGAWRAVLSLGLNPRTHKRERASKTFPTKKEAIEWRTEQARQLAAGTLTHTATTLGEWLTTWQELRSTSASANTQRTENSTIKLHLRPGLGAVRLKDLKGLVIERWLVRLAKEDVSQNERHKCGKLLRLVLNDAAKRRLIAVSPMAGMTIPQPPEAEAESLTQDELKAFLAAADKAGHGPQFHLWADGGFRPGEFLGLIWEDFDPIASTISVKRAVCGTTGKLKAPKTRRSKRTLLLAASTVKCLKAIRGNGSSPITPTPTGCHWWPENFRGDVFNPIAKAAGVKATPYTLRHTMATLLLQKNVSLKVVSERLGHEDVVTTLRSYAHVLPGMQQQAALAMEEILSG